MSTFSIAAKEYAAKGLPVFPCGLNKKPLTKHGFQDASTDPAQIETWGSKHPDANIGMPTGSITGRVVVDLDLDPEKGKDGPAEMAKLEAIHGSLPPTRTMGTPRGGRHLYFALPAGVTIRSRTDHPAPGIDIRAEGGYVLVPPSRTERGAYTVERKGTLADLPPWLLELLIDQPRPAPAPRPPPVVDAYADTDEEKIRSALRFLSPNMGNSEWVQIGMALHSWDPVRGLALWEEWSVPGQTYQPGETARRWKSFTAVNGGRT